MNIPAFERAAALDNLPVFTVGVHPYREAAAAPLDQPGASEMPRLVALHCAVLGGARVAAACATGEHVSLEVVVAAAMLAIGAVLLLRTSMQRARRA